MDHRPYFLVAAFFVLPLSAPAQPSYQFQPDVRVNTDAIGLYYHFTGFTNGHSIGLHQGVPFIIWQGTQEDGVHSHIYLSKSIDGGNSFLPAVRVDSWAGIYTAWGPTLVVDTIGVLYAGWTDSSTGSYHLYAAKSTDGGMSFTPAARVDSTGGVTPQLPDLALGPSGTLYCTWSAWQDTLFTASNVYLAKSTDGGLTFSPAVLVDSTLNLRATASNVAVDSSGTVFLAWRDNRSGSYYHVYFCKSTDGGNTFTPPVEVDIPGPTGTFPSLAVSRSGQLIYCAYKQRDTGIHHIYVSRSTDGGQSFGGRIQTDSTGESDAPNLAFREPDHVFLIWKDTRGGGWGDCYFSYSTDGGVSYSLGQRVNSLSLSGCEYPHLAFGPGDTIYACWTDRRNGSSYPDIYFAKGIPNPNGVSREGSVTKGDELGIQGPFPNPAKDGVRFSITSRSNNLLSLSIYDIQGKCVWQTSAVCKPGIPFSITWSAKGSDGRRATAGVYFLRWKTSGPQGNPKGGVKKFIVVK